MIERLKECFNEDFGPWLLRSNNIKAEEIRKKDSNDWQYIQWTEIENECLTQILDILLKEPEADYFWYTYPESGSRLIYSLPKDEVVPVGALIVDGNKIKAFLRNYKIESILNK
jgi:hypothetical protein